MGRMVYFKKTRGGERKQVPTPPPKNPPRPHTPPPPQKKTLCLNNIFVLFSLLAGIERAVGSENLKTYFTKQNIWLKEERVLNYPGGCEGEGAPPVRALFFLPGRGFFFFQSGEYSRKKPIRWYQTNHRKTIIFGAFLDRMGQKTLSIHPAKATTQTFSTPPSTRDWLWSSSLNQGTACYFFNGKRVTKKALLRLCFSLRHQQGELHEQHNWHM